MADSTLPYSSLRIKRSWVLPPGVAYVGVPIATVALLVSAQVASQGVGYRSEGRRNVDPSFLITPLDLSCIVTALIAFLALLVFLAFTREGGRVVAIIALACVLMITPWQVDYRRPWWERYEAGFLQWTSANVRPAPILAWQATLPPVTTATPVPPTAWPPVVTSLRPSDVIQDPNGVILRWSGVGVRDDSRRVFIGAAGGGLPPVNDENAFFGWKGLGSGFFAAYQTPG